MTKIIVVSDIHGNLKALDDALSRFEYDLALCCGDYLIPYQAMCDRFDYFVLGNNDFESHFFHNYWDIEVEQLKIHIEHGHEIGWYNQLNDQKYMKEYLKKTDWDLLLIGHTHIPFLLQFQNRAVVNPGSCAFPRGDSQPSIALITLDNKKIVNIQHHSL